MVGGFLLLVGLVCLALFVGRRMKGKAEMSLDSTAFEPGQTISGTFVVEPAKDLHARKVTAALICVETESIHGRDDTTQRRSQELFRKEVELAQSGELSADTMARYEFEIAVPDDAELPNRSTLRTTDGKHRWRVEGRVDLSGLDLKASEPIRRAR